MVVHESRHAHWAIEDAVVSPWRPSPPRTSRSVTITSHFQEILNLKPGWWHGCINPYFPKEYCLQVDRDLVLSP